jgi:hypothetical protein
MSRKSRFDNQNRKERVKTMYSKEIFPKENRHFIGDAEGLTALGDDGFSAGDDYTVVDGNGNITDFYVHDGRSWSH